MEGKITNLKKTDNSGYPLLWQFEYDGTETQVVEGEWDDTLNAQGVNVTMKMPEGRYAYNMNVSAVLFTSHENEMLTMAAEQCLKSYKKAVAK